MTFAGAIGLLRGQAAEATTKVSKEVAKYQDQPNAIQMCGMCKFYISPGGRAGAGMMGGHMGHDMMSGGQMGSGMMAVGSCKLVEGSISPMGWCVLYQPLPH
jgi:hypothetical protein